MKKGTPAGTQLDCAVKALFFPARISSMSCFIRSFTQGIRFGLERSAMRKVGCLLGPLGMKGCAGSEMTGARRPGTDSYDGPPPFSPTQPAKFDEKSGGAAFGWAAVGAMGAVPMRHARTPPARILSFQVNEDIAPLPYCVSHARLVHPWCRIGEIILVLAARAIPVSRLWARRGSLARYHERRLGGLRAVSRRCMSPPSPCGLPPTLFELRRTSRASAGRDHF